MKISIEAIEVEAFRNFAGPELVELGDLSPGLYGVRGVNEAAPRRGSNGAGKSTLFSDAPTWCLFGRTIGGLKTGDVKSWLGRAPARVALTLRAEGKRRTVQRGPRASDLTIDGETVAQEDVDALIGIDFAAWSQAIIWGQGQPLFLDLAPAAKMQLLSDALGLERWERRAEAAAARAKRLVGRLAGERGELAGLEAALDHAQADLSSSRERSERWAAEHASRLSAASSAVSEARKRATELDARRGEASMAADKAGTAAKLLRPTVEKARALVAEWSAVKRTADRGIAAAEERIAGYDAQVEQLTVSGTCPTCGQEVRARDAKKHAAEIEAKCAEERAALAKLVAARRDTRAIQKTAAKLEADEEDLARLDADYERASGEQRSLERELATARAEADAADKRVREIERETNPHRDAGQDARARVREIKTQVSEKDGLIEKLAASEERAQFWARGFREIRLGVVADVLEDLRETTAAVLEQLGLGDWEVDYAAERETKSGTIQRALTVTMLAPGAPEGVKWEVYSGGERQRLRLAGALALSEVLLAHAGVSCDFRVLDEPTRGLSPEGVRELEETLAEYAEQAGVRLFYVDHVSRGSGAFRGTATVINGKRGARVEIA